MKYALILPDGAADEPLAELGGQTPLQAANTPHTDSICAAGRIGTVRTVPEGFKPGSDVATLSVVGYDPREYYTGRAPLEAAAQQLDVGPRDTVFRCNLTTIIDGVMADFSAGHIAQADAETLISDLNDALGDERTTFFPGVMYRHLMVLRDSPDMDADCTPPHDIPDQPIAEHLPRGASAPLIINLMERSRALLEQHPVNQRRRREGQSPATSVWLWGQGHMPQLPNFRSRYGVQACCITAVDLIRGISVLAGWPLLEVDGATGYLDTNYRGKGARAVAALDEFDMVAVHIEAPDEAGHQGDAQEKVRAIEQVDEHVVGPVLSKLKSYADWKVLLLPDHPTPVSTRTHSSVPPPFCMAGSGIAAAAGTPPAFAEVNAENSGFHIDPGCALMGHFLGA